MSKRLFQLKRKDNGEILPHDHYLYNEVIIDVYGSVYALHENENDSGELVEWTEDLNDEYEVVLGAE